MINHSESSNSGHVVFHPSSVPDENAQSAAGSREDRIPICYVIPSIDTPCAGTERHLLQLLRSLDRERFDPLLILLRESRWSRECYDLDVPVHVLNMGSLYSPWSWNRIIRLARIMRKHQTRVAELYYVEGHFVGALAARLARVPTVFSWRRNLAHQYGIKERWMTRLTNPWVDRFLANSEAVRDVISRVEGISPSRFTVLPNGVDLEPFDRDIQADVSPEFEAFAQGKPIVVLMANLRPVKNIPCFLQAARRVAEARADVGFLVLGSGEAEAVLKRQSAEMGIADRVFWAGSVPHPAAYLHRSTVACLTSDSEGLANAILEYMAAGLPVVATNVGGASELIVQGQTGMLVDKGDATNLAWHVLELLESPTERLRMGGAGRRRVESRLSLDTAIEAYESLHVAAPRTT